MEKAKHCKNCGKAIIGNYDWSEYSYRMNTYTKTNYFCSWHCLEQAKKKSIEKRLQTRKYIKLSEREPEAEYV